MSDDPADSRQLSELVRHCDDMHPDVPRLTVAEFLAHSVHEPWLIVDCRPLRERLVSVLPGSVSLLQFRFQRARRKGKQLLVYRSMTSYQGASKLCVRVCKPGQVPPDAICDPQGAPVPFQPQPAAAPAPQQQPAAAPVAAEPAAAPAQAPQPVQAPQQQPPAQDQPPWTG